MSSKLVVHRQWNDIQHSVTSLLAILDVLLNLEYHSHQLHVQDLTHRMVASHMRTAYIVPTSRSYMYTRYPSEPILTVAALDLVWEATEKGDISKYPSGDPMLDMFMSIDTTNPGAIDKGERGKNVGKMLLLRAYMQAVVHNLGVQPTPSKIPWQNRCSLATFLKCLAAKPYHDVILNSKPDNTTSDTRTLEKAFENSWVRFMHFARAADNSAMTSTMSWVAYVRGMAVIGWHSQASVDLQIPVMLDKNGFINEENMSSILVQFRLKGQESTLSTAAVNQANIRYFPPNGSRRDAFFKVTSLPGLSESDFKDRKDAYCARPYISLVMELAIMQTEDKNPARLVSDLLDAVKPETNPTSTKKDTTSKKTESMLSQAKPTSNKGHKSQGSQVLTAPQPTRQGTCLKRADMHPRYSLFIYGCSQTVYRHVNGSSRANYLKLLQIGSIFGDHPLIGRLDLY